METMNFDLAAPREIPVTIDGMKYVLREATSEAACKWRNYMAKQARFAQSEGPGVRLTSVGDVADSEPLLVSLCLFKVYEHEGKTSYQPIPLDVVKKWPAKMVKALHTKAMEISDLSESESPLRKILTEALERSDGPTTLYLFREWAETISKEDAKYQPLYELVKESKEDKEKNS